MWGFKEVYLVEYPRNSRKSECICYVFERQHKNKRPHIAHANAFSQQIPKDHTNHSTQTTIIINKYTWFCHTWFCQVYTFRNNHNSIFLTS